MDPTGLSRTSTCGEAKFGGCTVRAWQKAVEKRKPGGARLRPARRRRSRKRWHRPAAQSPKATNPGIRATFPAVGGVKAVSDSSLPTPGCVNDFHPPPHTSRRDRPRLDLDSNCIFRKRTKHRIE